MGDPPVILPLCSTICLAPTLTLLNLADALFQRGLLLPPPWQLQRLNGVDDDVPSLDSISETGREDLLSSTHTDDAGFMTVATVEEYSVTTFVLFISLARRGFRLYSSLLQPIHPRPENCSEAARDCA